jgi:hypothetical protein
MLSREALERVPSGSVLRHAPLLLTELPALELRVEARLEFGAKLGVVGRCEHAQQHLDASLRLSKVCEEALRADHLPLNRRVGRTEFRCASHVSSTCPPPRIGFLWTILEVGGRSDPPRELPEHQP